MLWFTNKLQVEEKDGSRLIDPNILVLWEKTYPHSENKVLDFYRFWFCFVWFYGISTIEIYLIHFYT